MGEVDEQARREALVLAGRLLLAAVFLGSALATGGFDRRLSTRASNRLNDAAT